MKHLPAARVARLAVLLSGRGSNLVALAESCQSGVLKGCAQIVLVVSNRPEALGLARAAERGLPVAGIASQGRSREEFEGEILGLLESHQIDYVVLAGFMRILSPCFVSAWRHRIINIHPADPAVYRGPSGYRHAFERRLAKTSITVHLVEEEVDTGQILATRDVSLDGATTLEEIERRGLTVEHTLYPEALAAFLRERFHSVKET